MSQKDYVKASRPKAKPANKRPARRNTKATAQKPRLPWFILAITMVLICGFIYFLWFLNQQPESTTIVEKPAPKITKPQDELPAKPTEEPYQYIKDLENKEI